MFVDFFSTTKFYVWKLHVMNQKNKERYVIRWTSSSRRKRKSIPLQSDFKKGIEHKSKSPERVLKDKTSGQVTNQSCFYGIRLFCRYRYASIIYSKHFFSAPTCTKSSPEPGNPGLWRRCVGGGGGGGDVLILLCVTYNSIAPTVYVQTIRFTTVRLSPPAVPELYAYHVEHYVCTRIIGARSFRVQPPLRTSPPRTRES